MHCSHIFNITTPAGCAEGDKLMVNLPGGLGVWDVIVPARDTWQPGGTYKQRVSNPPSPEPTCCRPARTRKL
jgi:hypothetical protein